MQQSCTLSFSSQSILCQLLIKIIEREKLSEYFKHQLINSNQIDPLSLFKNINYQTDYITWQHLVAFCSVNQFIITQLEAEYIIKNNLKNKSKWNLNDFLYFITPNLEEEPDVKVIQLKKDDNNNHFINIIKNEIEAMKELDEIRENLYKRWDYNIAASYKSIELGQNKNIDAQKIQLFFTRQKNKIMTTNDVLNLINKLDKDQDGFIDKQDFLYLILNSASLVSYDNINSQLANKLFNQRDNNQKSQTKISKYNINLLSKSPNKQNQSITRFSTLKKQKSILINNSRTKSKEHKKVQFADQQQSSSVFINEDYNTIQVNQPYSYQNSRVKLNFDQFENSQEIISRNSPIQHIQKDIQSEIAISQISNYQSPFLQIHYPNYQEQILEKPSLINHTKTRNENMQYFSNENINIEQIRKILVQIINSSKELKNFKQIHFISHQNLCQFFQPPLDQLKFENKLHLLMKQQLRKDVIQSIFQSFDLDSQGFIDVNSLKLLVCNKAPSKEEGADGIKLLMETIYQSECELYKLKMELFQRKSSSLLHIFEQLDSNQKGYLEENDIKKIVGDEAEIVIEYFMNDKISFNQFLSELTP